MMHPLAARPTAMAAMVRTMAEPECEIAPRPLRFSYPLT